MVSNRDLHFTPEEMERVRKCAAGLNTSMPEFIWFSTMQAVQECESLAADAERVRAFYAQANGR